MIDEINRSILWIKNIRLLGNGMNYFNSRFLALTLRRTSLASITLLFSFFSQAQEYGKYGYLLNYSTSVKNNFSSSYVLDYSRYRGHQEVTLRGELLNISNKRLDKIIQLISPELPLLFHVQSSYGGNIEKFEYLSQGIKKKCNPDLGACRITMIISRVCFSACTYLPFIAERRLILDSAKFGVHNAVLALVIGGKKLATIKKNQPELMADSYIKSGGSKQWFLDNISIFSDQYIESGYWLNADELIRAGFVNEVVLGQDGRREDYQLIEDYRREHSYNHI